MNFFRRAFNFLLTPLRKRRSQFIFLMLQLIGRIFSLFPRKVGFAFIVMVLCFRLPGKTVLPKAFAPLAVGKLLKRPAFRFSSAFSRLFPTSEVVALYGIGAYREVCEAVVSRGLHVTSPLISTLLVRSLFELGDFEHARSVMHMVFSPSQLTQHPAAAHLKGLLDLVAGDLPEAVPNLLSASRGMPHVMHPHQNLAARYPQDYQPHRLDSLSGARGRLYDAANYMGQRVTHVGQGQVGPALYAIALQAQKELAEAIPPISKRLAGLLDKLEIPFEELRILPEEWYSQIGHLGMLDMLFRMRDIGWWKGQAVMLARGSNIANHAFLRLYERQGPLLIMGGDVDAQVSAELISLQRWKGMSFNAFELPNGTVVPWQDAGALMMQQWEKEGRGYPVRDEFDRLLGFSATLSESVAEIKKRWGMKPDDWYVCLHMRDAAHYGELAGTGQTHRNASVDSYLAAIKYVTDKGGWVIKLGGPKSPKLPSMPRVFDYARSDYRSDVMDLHLIRNARFLIGTTSGLTNVAVSFGVPCALVNCITTDAQLWSNRVRFALKWIKLRDGTLINQLQVTSTPWRWRVFSAELLGRASAFLEENTTDEILETVKEVDALASGRTDEYLQAFPDAAKVQDVWRHNLAFPYFYGDALPGLYAVSKHKGFLKWPAEHATAAAAE